MGVASNLLHFTFFCNNTRASEYFTTLEEFSTGVIPTFSGPLLLGLHPILIGLFVMLRVSESADAHCGYDFPWSIWRLGRPGDRHDFHHSHNLGNYGAWFSFWDWICGTDAAYQQYLMRKQK